MIMTDTQQNDVYSRKRELQTKIEEMEATLKGLREELGREEEDSQHEAIDHLESYLGDIDNKYTSLRDFWAVIREEFTALIDARSAKSGDHKEP